MRQESFGGILFSPSTGNITQVNKTAYLLLEGLANTLSLGEITNRIAETFNIPIKKAHEIMANNSAEFRRSYDVSSIRFLSFDKKKWAVKRSFLSSPEGVCIRLHNACNMSCEACYIDRTTPREMNISTVSQLLKECNELNVCRVNLGGGEVFLKDSIFLVAELAAKNNLFVSVTTNGTLIGREMARKIADSSIGLVSVSLDAVAPEVYSYTRERDFYLRTLEGINNLSRAKQRFSINVLITRKNVHNLYDTIKKIFDLGAARVKLLRPKPNHPNKTGNSEWFQTNRVEKEATRILNIYMKLKPAYPGLNLDCAFGKLLYPIGTDVEEWHHGCLAATRSMTIDCDGKVYPCPFFNGLEDYCAGTYLEDTLSTLWNASVTFHKVRKAVTSIQGEWNANGLPSHCGGCRRIAFEDNGNICSQDSLCIEGG